MRFDRPTDPRPLDVATAIRRGILLVNGPVLAILCGGFAGGLVLMDHLPVTGGLLAGAGFFGAWAWWSWRIPQWRDWALARGVDAKALQAAAVAAQLTWPHGSWLERTEFRRRKPPAHR